MLITNQKLTDNRRLNQHQFTGGEPIHAKKSKGVMRFGEGSRSRRQTTMAGMFMMAQGGGDGTAQNEASWCGVRHAKSFKLVGGGKSSMGAVDL